MQRIPILIRLFAAVLIASTMAGAGFYLTAFYLVKDKYLVLQVERMLASPAQAFRAMDSGEIFQLGINRRTLNQFLKNSSSNEQGFIADGENGEQAVLIKKTASGFLVHSRPSGFWAVFGHELTLAGFLLVVIAAASALAVYLLGRLSFVPLGVLRRTTENILAGHFEVRLKYKASDDLGRTFEALRMLCTELESRSQALEKVSALATTDGLTGLKNHRSFKEELQRQIKLAQRHGTPLGLILLDVDHFKKFNDTYGHQQGDEVLRIVSKTLLLTARQTDFVARYGGEEFVVVLPNTNREGVTTAAEKMRKAIEAAKVGSLNKLGETLSVTSSFGALAVEGTELLPKDKDFPPAEFIEICDQNLYKAKRLGRNCVVVGGWKKQAA